MADDEPTPSEEIDAIIGGLGDWRGERLAMLRTLIHRAVPEVEEHIKWRKPSNPDGVPTWERDGMLCTGEVYKDKVKLTFPKGAALDDPDGVFNASLGGNARRAIDVHEDTEVDDDAFVALMQRAADHNAG